ncbi:MAG: tellurite resistance protein [Gaiellaceae bacterium]|nr:tellurite resistance protein [Gaiellaceae bacterium]
MSRTATRIPPNLFGIALGLSGLAALWGFARTSFGGPAAVGDVLGVLAAVVWVGLMVAYLRQGPRRILADGRDPTVGPFLAAPVMSAYVLAAGVLEPHAPEAARVIVIAFLAIGLLVGGLLMGQWLTGGLEEATFGPAFFLPGIGIGFVGADAAATVGLHSIAQLFFGIGIAGWVLISSVTLNRMFFRPRLAPGLLPTMAIEMAPAAVAGNAYFLIHTGPPDLLLLGLSGYAALMTIAQLRLLPLYRTLSFTPGFWSFTFPPANMALFGLRWLEQGEPAGSSAYAWFLVAAITVLVGSIAARTIVAVARGQLLPSPGGAPAVAPSRLAHSTSPLRSVA